MLFKKLLSSSSSGKKPDPASIPRLSNPSGPADGPDESKETPELMITRERSRDYEAFLETAKKEADTKEKDILKLAKEAERRRKEFSMDPWTSRW
jgi:hypothetical protein